MAEVTATLIKDLRERTGAGMADCKKALTEVAGDMDKAIDYLRAKGLAKAAKKAGREATEGAVVVVHPRRRPDRRAGRDQLRDRLRRAQRGLPGVHPRRRDADRRDEPAVRPHATRSRRTSIDREREVLVAKAKETGKPERRRPEDGRRARSPKWMKEICLLDQAWVKDGDKTIEQVQQELIAKIGENIKVRRFVRFELGEGLEKKKDDFAAEVAKQAGLAQ